MRPGEFRAYYAFHSKNWKIIYRFVFRFLTETGLDTVHDVEQAQYSVRRPVWIEDQFKEQYEFRICSRMAGESVPGSLWIKDPFQVQYGFGSRLWFDPFSV